MPAADRELLARCLHAALAAVDGRSVVAEELADMDLPPGLPVLAVGKAAGAMLAGVADRLGGRIGPALCIPRADSLRAGDPRPGSARMLTGDHPVPGAASLAAGRALLAFLDDLPPRVPLLCLWSGGSSALVEVLPDGVGAAELARANRWLLASGLPIAAINRVRAQLSCLKAGRLALRLAGRRVLVLAVSDVPEDDPAVIGSGPWTPPELSPAARLPDELPAWLTALLARAPPVPAPGDPGLAEVEYRIVANGRRALAAIDRCAKLAGVPVDLHDVPLRGDVAEAAVRVLAALEAGQARLHAWSGETTVRLPRDPGKGGRNSHLALTLSCTLEGRDDVVVLCAATDGCDGEGGAAGGWADGRVVARGKMLGLDAREALACANSGAYLAATGDALVTGPTGTNVMDLVLALRSPSATVARRGPVRAAHGA